MPTRRILSVGQCLMDHGAIERTLQQWFTVEVAGAATAHEALQRLDQERFDLILVNRVFDADGGSGLELIRALQADARFRSVPVMLVSNYADAQEQARQLGAVPGFGKAALGQPQMRERLQPFLEAAVRC